MDSISKTTAAALSQDESLVSPVSAILCCDPNGLILGTRGNVLDDSKAASYTSIMRLASQLSSLSSSSPSLPNSHSGTHGSLLVSVETLNTTILLKEYNGHSVVLDVPTIGFSDAKKDGVNDSNEGEDSLSTTDVNGPDIAFGIKENLKPTE